MSQRERDPVALAELVARTGGGPATDSTTTDTGPVPTDPAARAPSRPSPRTTQQPATEPAAPPADPAPTRAPTPAAAPYPQPRPPLRAVGDRPTPPAKENKRNHSYMLPPSVGQVVTAMRDYLTEVEGQRTSNNVLVEDAIVAYSQQLLADRGLDAWPPVS